MVPRRLVWFCDVSLTMQDLERMYSFDLKERNEHKAEDANGLQEQLACIKQHASRSHVLQFFYF